MAELIKPHSLLEGMSASSEHAGATRSTNMGKLEERLRAIASRNGSRENLWVDFINSFGLQEIAEIGVYRGDFAQVLLRRCEGLTRYYMIDPWKHLADWNKPSNHTDVQLEAYYRESLAKTDFAAGKRVVLRGKTTDVIGQIADETLDFAYVDGDHTLKGITIDLISVYPKVKVGGYLTGDDFSSSIWQHQTAFEPTLVFPLSVYFAEAVGATIFALPHSQFCLQKGAERHFSFVDLTGEYGDTSLRNHVAPEKLLTIAMWERFPGIMSVLRKAKATLFSQ
jgi:hypothetical protein